MEKLKQDEEILASLEAAVCPSTQALTGMPHTPGIKDRVGDLAVEIADMKNEVDRLHAEIKSEEHKIVAFIQTIEDERMRTIFRLRFFRCLSWPTVALLIGGKNTAEGIKTACYRFLRVKR